MNPLVSLLVGLAISISDPCSVPPGYMNNTSRTEGDLKFTFAMDEFVYSESDTIRFHYIVENIGQDTFYVNWGIDPMYAFFIYPDSCFTLDQPGCFDEAIYYYPQIVYYYSEGIHLLPGECKVFSESWDQSKNTDVTPGPGSYRVFGGLWKPDPGPSWPGSFQLQSELALEIVIEDPIETDVQSWGRIKSLHNSDR